ncbi:hypothetical protein J2X31_003476 [Flavobacterium arsenatis]|uniref:Abortive phage resistance protein n=1 Tax=Flavobacterium arsenatis TaxID=1484332 RepID=A0ABU1TUC2_9FLAO|nr:abortive infection system antitoxin AbiGi family protein [Flavobacterium arsenatis]MDR6969445.1 hypothetical protein [Flavobacterium arsenatis]
MKKERKEIIESKFNQKKINHIFHYLDNFEILIKILKNGFAPSYCKEIINDTDYYIPMVSFCNIPLRDVDLYMRYGKYGIGLSLDWALENSISPVIYTHEKTPFKNLHSKINQIQLYNLSRKMFKNILDATLNNQEDETDYKEYDELIKNINNVTVPTIQFFKNWKTKYKSQEIITYQEREWRYVPTLENEKSLITKGDTEFEQLEEKVFRKKPHLPNHILDISKIEYLRYVIIQNEKQSDRVLNTLKSKFGEENVINSILSGKLMIINDDLIFNDF